MVVVLSNNEFSDAVSGIIERDYFPSYEQCDQDTTGSTADEKSLTEFHRTTTSVTALQLHETLEEKRRAVLHKQSLLYTSNQASAGSDSSVTAELRNALYFPVSITETFQGATTNASSDPSVLMPPPRKRKPVPLTLNRKNNDDEYSCTTVQTGKTANIISSSTLINASATRFPITLTHSQRRRRSSKKRNCYSNNNNAEEHWEGSTNNGEDDDSYFTDLDATTVDSYSIRMELRKAVVASRNKEQQYVPVPSSMGSELVGTDTSSMSNPLVYRLPRESPRDLSASIISQQRSEEKLKTRVHRHRHNFSSATLLQGGRSSNRSIKSLRSALKESYRKS